MLQGMSALVSEFIHNCWNLLTEMAPYLLFGFAVAGLLHWLIRKELVQRWLGKPGMGTVVRASVLGVPMPLCSCSVIPVAASLRKSGASRGATASFLSSTPQTGIDSILATYALLGGVFTIVRVVVAFISGFVSGLLVDLFAKETPTKFVPSGVSLKAAPIKAQASRLDLSNLTPLATPPANEPKRNFGSALRYGLITLPADLASALITGLLLAGLITTLMPESWLSGTLGSGIIAFVIATLISLPLYVCATASIPMAYALMTAGLSPGAALIFLIVGPATNTATVVAVWDMLGRTATLIYIASLVLVSWIAGWVFDQSLVLAAYEPSCHTHHARHPALWQQVSGLTLLILLAFAYWTVKLPKQKKSCCGA